MKVILYLTILVFFNMSNIYTQSISKMEKVWTIGSDEKASMDYIFRDPEMAKVDKNGNLYVLDQNSCEIKKYSSDGKYMAKYGRQGKGPGEFVNITNYCINNDNIVVYDVTQKRFTLVDIKKGTSKTFNYNSTMEPAFIEYDGKSAYVVSERWNMLKNNLLITLYSEDFKIKREEFGDLKALLNLDDKYQKMFKDEWCYDLADPSTLYATPKWYSNILYVFKKDKGVWSYKSLTGSKLPMRSYELFSENEFLTKKELKISVAGFQGNKIFYKLYNRSLGIITLKNKYILRFMAQKLNIGTYEVGCDMFKYSGEYIGYTKLNSTNDIMALYSRLLATNKTNAVYFKEYINKVPVISKYKIEVN